jgi:hypothetical protein
MEVLFSQPQNIKQMIDKQVAVISLYWAQGILECSRSLLQNVQLQVEDAMEVRSKFTKKMVFQIRYTVEYDASNCRGREPRRGMVVFFKTKSGRKFPTKISRLEPGKCHFVIRTETENEAIYLDIDNEVTKYSFIVR